MELVAQYDLELHQIDVKIDFLNGGLEEEIYMHKSERFFVESKRQLVCKVKNSKYVLKQASQQWYIKFITIITSLCFYGKNC